MDVVNKRISVWENISDGIFLTSIGYKFNNASPINKLYVSYM